MDAVTPPPVPPQQTPTTITITAAPTAKKMTKAFWLMAILNIGALAIGTTAGPLVSRMYFNNGGSSIWFSGVLQTVGFPLASPIIMYQMNKKPGKGKHINMRLALLSALIGLLTGVDVYIYAWGLSYLPVSTSQVLIATQLGFTAVFAFLLVRQNFTAYSINAVILLTLSSVIMALHGGANDRPAGVTRSKYVLGFVLTLVAAAMYGLIIPLVDLSYRLGRREVTYTVVMEMQTVMSAVATVFLVVGLLASGEMNVITEEARAFRGGGGVYMLCCVFSALTWELYYIGIYGVTFQVNSLLSGIVIAAMIPPTEVLAVLFFKESFNTQKGLAVAVALWGVISYLFGEYKQSKEQSGAENGEEDQENTGEEAEQSHVRPPV